MTKTIPILCLLVCPLFSCNEIYVNENRGGPAVNDLRLVETGVITFELDTLTAPNTNNMQLFTDNRGNRFFTFLNSYLNALYIYDFDTQNLLNIVKYRIDGDNGVGKIMGYHIHSFDSIFVYNYGHSTLAITDAHARVLKRIKIDRQANHPKYAPTPKLMNGMPLIKSGKLAIMSGNLGGEYLDENEQNRPVQCFINLESGSYYFSGSYPDIYRLGNWGGQLFRYVYQTHNPNTNLVILSFPADHYLRVFDIANKTYAAHYASSQLVGGISSYSSRKYLLHDKLDLHRHYTTNPAYLTVFYDKFRNIYLRFFSLPVTDYDFAVREKRTKTYGVVLLDDRFAVKGYHLFPKFSHSPTEVFFTKEGIFIKRYQEDEDKMVFSRYQLKAYR